MAEVQKKIDPAILYAIIAGCVISFVSFGFSASFGVFLRPMSADLGWGREIFSLSLAIQALMWGVTQPLAGAYADKHGSTQVLAFGAVFAALGFALRGLLFDETMFILTGFIVGIGTGACSFPVVIVALGKVVEAKQRSFILGLGTAAASAGMFAGAPIATTLIGTIGWGVAIFFVAASFLIILPLLIFVSRASKKPSPLREKLNTIQAIKTAFSDRSYTLLFFGFFVCGFHVQFIQTHLPAYITDEGLAPIIGAWSLALIGLFNIGGSFFSGWSGQIYSKPKLLAAIYASRAAVIALFIFTPLSGTSVLVFSAAMGILWLSTVPLTTGLIAQTQGLKFLSTLAGLVFFSHQVGGFLGAWLGGRLYDLTGNYEAMWIAAILFGLAATIIHLPIKEQPGKLAQAEIN
ncbi:MFS transporter [Paracoccaceae bacterium]|nr:MFS transporter [Paracoccaceae bacterium]